MQHLIIALMGFVIGTGIGVWITPTTVIERQSECVPTSVREVASLRVSQGGTLVCTIRPVRGYGEAA